MKTQELRQGNRIKQGIVHMIGYSEGVLGVHVLESEFSSISKFVKESDIKPVELTLDVVRDASGVIFMRNYHICDENNKCLYEICHEYIEPSYCFTYRYSRSRHVVLKYLHQFQNLHFALTEKELTS